MADVSIAIPTFGREEVLLDTIRACLGQTPCAREILVIDQTPDHLPSTEQLLGEWHNDGKIRWERLSVPSIPTAMNRALVLAKSPLVLFLDDDIIPGPGLVSAHASAHDFREIAIVVGQIIQPWQEPSNVVRPPDQDTMRADFDFPFHSTQKAELQNAMAGHMSVVRDKAIEIGGFDENFRGTAYRFETEFARRMIHAGSTVIFEPSASIHHLRAARGGTRTHGNHLASPSPNHGLGDYYFALLAGHGTAQATYILRRMMREICTRFHLRHPWYIPVKLFGEIRAFCWALQLYRRGPALLERSAT